jgi:hypothetical protein
LYSVEHLPLGVAAFLRLHAGGPALTQLDVYAELDPVKR